MRILQTCALVSVCVIAAAALALVAMGYSIRLEAPESHAAQVPGLTMIYQLDHSAPALLMDDGTVYQVSDSTNQVEFIEENSTYMLLPPSVAPEDVVMWGNSRVITADGTYWNWYDHAWRSAPLPSPPVGASTGSTSGVKGRYGGN